MPVVLGPGGRPYVVALHSFGGSMGSYYPDLGVFALPPGGADWMRPDTPLVRYATPEEVEQAGLPVTDPPAPAATVRKAVTAARPETVAELRRWLTEHGITPPSGARKRDLRILYNRYADAG